MHPRTAALLALAILPSLGLSCHKTAGPTPQPNNQCVCALLPKDVRQPATPTFTRYQTGVSSNPPTKPVGWHNLPVQIADVDGDGIQGLSTYSQKQTPIAGGNNLFFRLRTPFFAYPGLYPGRDASSHGTALVDLDGDGFLDMIIAPHSEKGENQPDEPIFYVGRTKSDPNVTNRPLCVQQNDWRIVPIWLFLASIPGANPLGWSSETIAVGDVDGDGRTDVYLTFYPDGGTHRSLLLMNTGRTANCEGIAAPLLSEEAVKRNVNGPAVPDPEGANMVDLRGTGQLDLVSASLVYINNASDSVRQFCGSVNNGVAGLGQFTRCRLIDLGLPSDTFHEKDEGLHVVDYNRDGKFDLFLRVQERKNLLWQRCDAKNASAPLWFVNDFDKSNLHAILGDKSGHNWGDAWGDFDLDGSFDLIYQTGDSGGTAASQKGLILLNDGHGHFRMNNDNSDAQWTIPYSDVTAVGDLNNDGLLDLYFAGKGELYLNTTTPPAGAHALAVSPRDHGRRDQYGATVLVKETCPHEDGSLGQQIMSVGGPATYLAQGQYDAHIGVEEGQCYDIVVQFPRGPDGAPRTADIRYDPATERGRRLVVERQPPPLYVPKVSGTTPFPIPPRVVAREPYGP